MINYLRRLDLNLLITLDALLVEEPAVAYTNDSGAVAAAGMLSA